MNPILKAHCETGNFSRGYLMVGKRESVKPFIRQAAAILLKYDENLLDSHPDFSEQFFDLFGLEETQNLRFKTWQKPILAAKRVFSLGITTFSHEAVLPFSKILDDSPLSCHFFLNASFSEDVPVLVRSRLINISEGDTAGKLSEDKKIFYENFLKDKPVNRLSSAKDAISDRRRALEFLNELEVIISERLKRENRGSPLFKNLISSLEDLKTSRQYLFDRASSPKMIIEHFSLTLPQF